jgi:site-specific recombinase XerD
VTIIEEGAAERQSTEAEADWSPAVWLDASAVARADELAELGERMRDYVTASKSPNTLRAYRSDWADFTGWCDARDLAALPASPGTVAAYLTDLAETVATATLARRVTSISQAHKAAGHEDPPTRSALVHETMKGIRRTFGVAAAKKAPLRSGDIRTLVATLDVDSLGGLRDRALLVVGFAGAFRRSELVALDVADVDWTTDGLVVRIRRSKTDQQGEGTSIGLPFGSDPATCPVRTLRAWLDAAGIEEGAIFRQVDRHGRMAGRMSARAAAERVKVACARAGLDAARYGGHSLRAGLITSAIEGGATEFRTMAHSRHRSVHVFRGYVRDLNLLDGDNPVTRVGL